MQKSLSVWRVLAASTAVIVIAAGVAYYKGAFQPLGFYRPANSIMVLMPYRHAGTWVFDDPAVGLRKEPFVAGVPEMMDAMVKDIPDADNGFRLCSQPSRFPDTRTSWFVGVATKRATGTTRSSIRRRDGSALVCSSTTRKHPRKST